MSLLKKIHRTLQVGCKLLLVGLNKKCLWLHRYFNLKNNLKYKLVINYFLLDQYTFKFKIYHPNLPKIYCWV